MKTTGAQTHFSKILRALLVERKLTVREAAKIAGVAPSTISAWCTDTVPHDFRAVMKLARALNVSFTFLLTGEHDPKSGTDEVSVAEAFIAGNEIFNGFAKIVMVELIPRKPKKI